MRGLKNKRVIIGGGATGIGAALAARLVEEGSHVLVGDLNAAGLNTLLSDLSKKGRASGVVFDLADETSINALVQQAADTMGGIDGLVIPGADLSKNNMGRDHDLMRMEADVWERTFRVNLLGHALLMKATIPHMVKAGGGSIVSVSSAQAYKGLNTMPAYAATKAGLHALARHVARISGKDKIRCNIACPGFVPTEGAKVNMTDELMQTVLASMSLPRLGEADDIGALMAFLLSDDAAWLTGQVISINGGSAFRD